MGRSGGHGKGGGFESWNVGFERGRRGFESGRGGFEKGRGGFPRGKGGFESVGLERERGGEIEGEIEGEQKWRGRRTRGIGDRRNSWVGGKGAGGNGTPRWGKEIPYLPEVQETPVVHYFNIRKIIMNN